MAISSEIVFCFYKIDFFYESKTYWDTTKALKKKSITIKNKLYEHVSFEKNARIET